MLIIQIEKITHFNLINNISLYYEILNFCFSLAKQYREEEEEERKKTLLFQEIILKLIKKKKKLFLFF
jgi:hypothetical protein